MQKYDMNQDIYDYEKLQYFNITRMILDPNVFSKHKSLLNLSIIYFSRLLFKQTFFRLRIFPCPFYEKHVSKKACKLIQRSIKPSTNIPKEILIFPSFLEQIAHNFTFVSTHKYETNPPGTLTITCMYSQQYCKLFQLVAVCK